MGLDTESSANLNLKRLVVYRHFVLALQVAALLAANLMAVSLPLVPIMLLIMVFAGINALTWARLRWLDRPVSDPELFWQLLVDVLIWGALLYFTGGSTNPFVSLFLVPISLAAASLSGRRTWTVAGAALLTYSLLMLWRIPLPRRLGDNFNLHVLGMWFGFVLSATLISYFAVRMGATLRARERALALAREQALRDERLVALGTLAAGTAHELGTPLGTMAVLVKDLAGECAGHPDLAHPLRILRDQIVRCKDILSKLADSSGQVRAEAGGDVALDHYLTQLTDQWHRGRPAVGLRRQWEGTRPAPHIVSDQTLTQAITNVLNNAADACEQDVAVHGRWDEAELCLEISDGGVGVSAAAAGHVGEPFFTTKPPGRGMGLGLYLAQATIKRLGGTVRLYNRSEGGACARIVLPLSPLTLKP